MTLHRSVSDDAKDLAKRMLGSDPKGRLIAQEALEHLWLQDAKKAPNIPLGDSVKARLKQFSVMNKLKKRALMVIAEHLSVEEVATIKEVFEIMDTNKRGKINLEELRVGVQKVGLQIPDADLQILMEAADFDGDGALNYGEFVAVSVHLRKLANDEHLHKALAFFDLKKSGYIDLEELRAALGGEDDSNSDEVINAIMHDLDLELFTVEWTASQSEVLYLCPLLQFSGRLKFTLCRCKIFQFTPSPLKQAFESWTMDLFVKLSCDHSCLGK